MARKERSKPLLASNKTKQITVAALGIVFLVPMAAPFVPAAQAHSGPLADGGFTRVWDRTDKPVEDRMAARSWTWGPDAFFTTYEPYAQGPGAQHLVTYFDKSRMEINDPSADRNS